MRHTQSGLGETTRVILVPELRGGKTRNVSSQIYFLIVYCGRKKWWQVIFGTPNRIIHSPGWWATYASHPGWTGGNHLSNPGLGVWGGGDPRM
jgi:hypothetical protein